MGGIADIDSHFQAKSATSKDGHDVLHSLLRLRLVRSRVLAEGDNRS